MGVYKIENILLINSIIYGSLIYILSIIFHEIGHGIMYWEYTKKNPTLKFKRKVLGFEILVGEDEEYAKLTSKQMIVIYLVGIVAGYLPIIWLFDVGLIMAGVVNYILYTINSSHDIRQFFYESMGVMK